MITKELVDVDERFELLDVDERCTNVAQTLHKQRQCATVCATSEQRFASHF